MKDLKGKNNGCKRFTIDWDWEKMKEKMKDERDLEKEKSPQILRIQDGWRWVLKKLKN